MTISIRARLLLLLLAIALLPLLTVTWLDFRAMRRLGQDLADEGRAVLTERARSQLVQITTNYVSILQGQIEVLKLLLGDQVREVEIRLAGPVPAHTGDVVFDSDIDRGTVPFTVSPPGPADTARRPVRLTESAQAPSIGGCATNIRT